MEVLYIQDIFITFSKLLLFVVKPYFHKDPASIIEKTSKGCKYILKARY